MKKAGVNDLSQGSPNLDFLQMIEKTFSVKDIMMLKKMNKKTAIVNVTTDISGGIVLDPDLIPVGSVIAGVKVIGTAVASGGTISLTDNAGTPNVICATIACAAVGTVAQESSIVQSFSTVGANGLRLLGSASGVRGVVMIDFI